jgi:multimeric flavodoxin WrbA
MKITMIAGSPHGLSGFGGKMAAIIDERLRQHGVSLETFSLADMNIRTCTGCYVCCQKGACIFNDDYQTIYDAMLAADGIIWLVPNYTFNVPAEMKAFIDRGFSNMHLQMLKGKYTLPVITSGSWLLEDALVYLEKTFQKNGCWVVDRVGISMAEWGQIEEEKKAQLLIGVDSLVAAIAEQRIFEEQVEPLREIFEMWRSYLSYFKEKYPHEHQYWISRWPNAPLD